MSPALEYQTLAPAAPQNLADRPRCQLSNRAFNVLPGVAFRRAESDGAKVMVVPLGERQAALPLRVLRHEFDIARDSEDDRMLSLIDAALDHVPGIALGEELPCEVVSGEASWRPEPHHLWLAAARLRAGLLAWLRPNAPMTDDPMAIMESLMSDPHLREQVQAAFEQAAHALMLPRPEDAVALVDKLARELSYIEALRDWLLGRTQAIVRRLATLPPQRGLDRQRSEMLQRVGLLATKALREMRDRFVVLDAQTGEVMAVLRNVEQQIVYIRQQRDALHTVLLEWNAVLTAWEKLPAGAGDSFWQVLGDTYHLLAQHHMPESAWRLSEAGLSAATSREMSW
jgi:hypothetical protein